MIYILIIAEERQVRPGLVGIIRLSKGVQVTISLLGSIFMGILQDPNFPPFSITCWTGPHIIPRCNVNSKSCGFLARYCSVVFRVLAKDSFVGWFILLYYLKGLS